MDGDEVTPNPTFPYVPALHVQLLAAELALGALVPAGQETHVVAFVAPVAVEYVPVPQSVHAALPLTILYLPATHAAHGPPSGPLNPARQATETHAFTLEPPLGDVVPAGHAVHALAPDTAEYVPALQFAHAVADVVDVGILLYLMMTMPDPPLPPTLLNCAPPPPEPVPLPALIGFAS